MITLEEYYKRTYFDTNYLIEIPSNKYICNMIDFINKDNQIELFVDMLFDNKKYRFKIYNFENEETMYSEINNQRKEISDYAKHVIYTVYQQYLEYKNKKN